MDYQSLTIEGFIDEVIQALDGYHTRKFCFVLGAGASRTSGIKSGQELVDLWDDELLRRNADSHAYWMAQEEITDENKYGFYSKYYERRFERTPGDGYNFLEKMMSSARPNIGYVILAYILNRPSHDTNVVITTNFDRLVEDAIHDYEQESPLVIGHESLAHYIKNPIKRPTVIKIHRDLLLDPKNSTKETCTLDSNWHDALDVIFSTYHPIFIGYAGNDDSLMDFLLENSSKFAQDSWCCPYWLGYKSDKLSKKVQDFLTQSRGFLISHDGFDEVLCLLGAKLNYVLPTEEEFIEKSKIRLHNLRDSFDKATQNFLDSRPTVPNKPETTQSDVARTDKTMLSQAIDQVVAQSELQNLYKQAVTLNSEKKYTEAVKIETQLIARQPNNALYHYRYALTLQDMEEHEKALGEFQRALELEPETAEYCYELGWAFCLLNRHAEALPHLEKAIELEPDEPLYLLGLGEALISTKHPDKAIPLLKKGVALDPGEVYPHLALARALCLVEHFDEAIPEIDAAIQLDLDDAYLYNMRGHILSDMNQENDALVAYQKAVDLDPEDAAYHFDLGLSLFINGDFEDSCREIQQAINIEPNCARYHNEWGLILHAESKYPADLALTPDELDVESVNALKEANAAIKSTLEKINDYGDKDIDEPPFDQELMAQAITELRKAAELAPENAIYQYDLGDALWDTGEAVAASIQIKKALALDPNNDQYQAAINRIEAEIACGGKCGSPA